MTKVNSELAERNRIKTVPLLAPRGKILDRDGRVIVDNHSAFELESCARESEAGTYCRHRERAASGLPTIFARRWRKLNRGARPKYVPVLIKQELTPAELAFVESHHDRRHVSGDGVDRRIRAACIRKTAWPRT